MISILALQLALLLLPAAARAAAGPTEAELRRMTGELLSAVASGDWAVWDRYLDDSMVYTSEDGRTMTKATMEKRRARLDSVRGLAASPRPAPWTCASLN